MLTRSGLLAAARGGRHHGWGCLGGVCGLCLLIRRRGLSRRGKHETPGRDINETVVPLEKVPTENALCIPNVVADKDGKSALKFRQ